MIGQCMGILDEPKREGRDLEENHLPGSSVLSLLCSLVFWRRDSGKISPPLSLLADKRKHHRASVVMHPQSWPRCQRYREGMFSFFSIF